tara:strand:- start:106 stop:249 length:144 start_codon:yes stop_codon:yes gene_type:complete
MQLLRIKHIKKYFHKYEMPFIVKKELLRFHFWMDMWRIADFIYKIVK